MVKKATNNEYMKHQHKVMIILGVAIVLFTFNWDNRVGIIFGSLIMGVGIARVKD